MQKRGFPLGSFMAWIFLLASILLLRHQLTLAVYAWSDAYPSWRVLTDAQTSPGLEILLLIILAIVTGFVAKPRFFWAGLLLLSLVWIFSLSAGIRPLYYGKFFGGNSSSFFYWSILPLILMLTSALVLFLLEKRRSMALPQQTGVTQSN